MLDQNTDRMWYVIGALVVGAGLILLANKTMPEVFAKVGKTFEGITDNTIANLDDEFKATPVKNGKNLIMNPDIINGRANHEGSGVAVLMKDEAEPYYRVTPDSDKFVSTFWRDNGVNNDEVFSEQIIQGEMYTIFVDVRVPVAGMVSFYNQQGKQKVNVENEWVTISYTYKYDQTKMLGGRIIGNDYNQRGQYLDYKNFHLQRAG